MSRPKITTLLIAIVVSTVIVFFLSPVIISSPDERPIRLDRLIGSLLHPLNLKYDYINNKTTCSAAGGKWVSTGFLLREMCQFYSKDKDKPCSSGYQCEFGKCFLHYDKNSNAPGKCSGELFNFGCDTELHFGKPDITLCTD